MNERRQFIKMLLGFGAGIQVLFSPLAAGVRIALAKAKKALLPKGTRMQTLIGRNPAELDTRDLDVTPLEEFGIMGLSDHPVDLNKWQLEITGNVRRSLKLTYAQILELPSVERNVLLICPGVFAYNARWHGVSAAKILEMARVDPGVIHVTFSGPAGTYAKAEQFPIEDILADRVFLAYRVNDTVLPKKHGFPLRVVAEGHYGGEWVKYVDKITANKP
jgi:DMSO/TMAO reductase YedYZ molybdopterin-dependent catalytic subunit